MTVPAGLLDFFILEAGDYVERLDGLLATAGPTGPDAEAFVKHARALRGSATMARLDAFAELSAAIERIGRGLRDGSATWGPHVAAALTSAVDELKILLRSVRTWGSAETQRAAARTAELESFAPAPPRPGDRATPATGGGSASFLGGVTGEIAGALEAYVARPAGDRSATNDEFTRMLGRVRALRGIAAIKDLPPLGEVVDALERAGKPIELGAQTPTPALLDVFTRAAAVLRAVSRDITAGRRPNPEAPEVGPFLGALAKLEEGATETDRIVPIAELFFHDGGPDILYTAAHPPTTPAERFRLEAVSYAENVRRLVTEAQRAPDAAARDRVGRELRSAMHSLRSAAESFGETRVGSFVGDLMAGVAQMDPSALSSVEEMARLLSTRDTSSEHVERRLDELARGRALDTAIGAGLGPTDVREPAGIVTTDPRLSGAIRPLQPTPPPTPVVAAELAPAPAPPPAAPVELSRERPAPRRAPTPAAVPAARPAPAASGAPSAPPAHAAPSASATSTRAKELTPTGRELHAMLEDGIVAVRKLDDRPLSEPVPVVDDSIVSIDELMYRGRSALQRAAEIGQEVRRRGAPPDPALLDELLDLIELATTD